MRVSREAREVVEEDRLDLGGEVLPLPNLVLPTVVAAAFSGNVLGTGDPDAGFIAPWIEPGWRYFLRRFG